MTKALPRSSAEGVQWLPAPVLVKGIVQRGFGRGSRDLGTPTANLPGKLLDGAEHTTRDGVYVGFGAVPRHLEAPVKMVANIGHNITYGDVKERVLEAYLMEGDLPTEFYGDEMRLCITGYLRPELKFDGLPALIEAISNDVAVAKQVLDMPAGRDFRAHPFLAE